ncbi:MAG: outer membrane beta-barrel protein [Terracidiphilus sp.]|nr:outer membrane beta-barrel protein [Terracidiphilus sp.]
MLGNRTIIALLCCALAAGTLSARAQVVPAATKKGLSLTAGGFGSAFQPDFTGTNVGTSINRLYGVGAYADLKVTRWVQIEAEARWLRFNQYQKNGEDNYLIGPRVPFSVRHFPRVKPYGKVLVGYGKSDFLYGSTFNLAFGGGVDYRLNNRFSIRAFDLEYQRWSTAPATLYPYGASVGLSYKIF